jgi:hypothetical protein
MTSEQYIKAQLAALAWREGYEQGGVNNSLAVAFVIKNRVRAGWGEWLELIQRHETWSAYNHNELDHKSHPDPREPDFQRLLQQIDGIYDGSLQDKLTVAPKTKEGEGRPGLYYGHLNKITREWFLENIVRKPELHPRTSQVGEVTFFG